MVLVRNPPCIVQDTFHNGTACFKGVLPLGQCPSMREMARADVDVIFVELRPVLKDIQSHQARWYVGGIFQWG